jgi:hypothetical protein
MRVLRWAGVVVFGVLAIGCSGSDATVAGPDDAASDSSTDASLDSSGGGDAGSGTDTGGADQDAGLGGDSNPQGTDASETGAGDAGPCPDEHGAYSVALTGAGCGDLAAGAPQCIQQNTCALTFVSSGSGGAKALNGNADLVVDGSFTGAAIKEGSVPRTGCTGTWSAATSTLTVDCGGVGNSQSCIATLTRTSMTCN